MTTLMELARSGALSSLTQPTTASQLLPDRFAPNSLYGSPLTIPYRTGWNSASGWTPEELNKITAQNQTAANYVGAAGGPEQFIAQTGGGTMDPSQWGIRMQVPTATATQPVTTPISSSPTNYYRAIGDTQYSAARQAAAQQYAAQTAANAQQNVIAPTTTTPSSSGKGTMREQPVTAPSMSADVINPDLGDLSGTRGGAQLNTTRTGTNNLATGTRGYTTPTTSRTQTVQPTMTQPTAQTTGLNYNPTIQQGQTPNPFIDKSGGFNFNAASGLYNNLNSYINPALQQALAQASAGNTAMGNYLYGSFPTWINDYLNSTLGTQGLEANNLRTAGLNYLFPYLDQLGPILQNQLQTGVPGTEQALANQDAYSNLVNFLLQGTGERGATGGPNYGVSDFYNQILNSGLPNQRAIESIVPSQMPYGENMQQQYANLLSQLAGGQNLPQTGLQGTAQNTIQSMLQTAGMSPEYVAAMERLVLEPQQEQ